MKIYESEGQQDAEMEELQGDEILKIKGHFDMDSEESETPETLQTKPATKSKPAEGVTGKEHSAEEFPTIQPVKAAQPIKEVTATDPCKRHWLDGKQKYEEFYPRTTTLRNK